MLPLLSMTFPSTTLVDAGLPKPWCAKFFTQSQ